MVKIKPLLIRYGINKNIVSLIEVSTMNSYGEVDIGRCAGSCRGVQSQLIRVSIIHSSISLFAYKRAFDEKPVTLPVSIFLFSQIDWVVSQSRLKI